MSEPVRIALGIVLGVGGLVLVYGTLLFVSVELWSRLKNLGREVSFQVWRWRHRRRQRRAT
jgi:hypothetical protein